jgi:hypothetical protein
VDQILIAIVPGVSLESLGTMTLIKAPIMFPLYEEDWFLLENLNFEVIFFPPCHRFCGAVKLKTLGCYAA